MSFSLSHRPVSSRRTPLTRAAVLAAAPAAAVLAAAPAAAVLAANFESRPVGLPSGASDGPPWKGGSPCRR